MNNPESFDDGKLRREVRKLEREVAASREEIGPEATEYLVDAIDDLEESIADLYDMIAERGAHSIATVEKTVRERPWSSLFAAFGAGCLVTFIVTRLR